MMERITLPDFLIAEMSNFVENIYPEGYKKFPFLTAIRQQFEEIPEIKEYYKGEKAMKSPFVSKMMATIKF